MKKIAILLIDEDGEVEVMKQSEKINQRIMDDIYKTYKKLNIFEKGNSFKKDNYGDLFLYDYSKKSTLDINSYAKI